jgi:hypothetical protein
MDEKQINEKDKTVSEKKVYTPPALNKYGKLTDLTASGTSNANETGMGSMA